MGGREPYVVVIGGEIEDQLEPPFDVR